MISCRMPILFVLGWVSLSAGAEMHQLRHYLPRHFAASWKSLPAQSKDSTSSRKPLSLRRLGIYLQADFSYEPPGVYRSSPIDPAQVKKLWGKLPPGEQYSQWLYAHHHLWIYARQENEWHLYHASIDQPELQWSPLSSIRGTFVAFTLDSFSEPVVIFQSHGEERFQQQKGVFTGGGHGIQWKEAEEVPAVLLNSYAPSSHRKYLIAGEFCLSRNANLMALSYHWDEMKGSRLHYRVSQSPLHAYGAWRSSKRQGTIKLNQNGQFLEYGIAGSDKDFRTLPDLRLRYQVKSKREVDREATSLRAAGSSLGKNAQFIPASFMRSGMSMDDFDLEPMFFPDFYRSSFMKDSTDSPGQQPTLSNANSDSSSMNSSEPSSEHNRSVNTSFPSSKNATLADKTNNNQSEMEETPQPTSESETEIHGDTRSTAPELSVSKKPEAAPACEGENSSASEPTEEDSTLADEEKSPGDDSLSKYERTAQGNKSEDEDSSPTQRSATPADGSNLRDSNTSEAPPGEPSPSALNPTDLSEQPPSFTPSSQNEGEKDAPEVKDMVVLQNSVNASSPKQPEGGNTNREPSHPGGDSLSSPEFKPYTEGEALAGKNARGGSAAGTGRSGEVRSPTQSVEPEALLPLLRTYPSSREGKYSFFLLGILFFAVLYRREKNRGDTPQPVGEKALNLCWEDLLEDIQHETEEGWEWACLLKPSVSAVDLSSGQAYLIYDESALLQGSATPLLMPEASTLREPLTARLELPLHTRDCFLRTLGGRVFLAYRGSRQGYKGQWLDPATGERKIRLPKNMNKIHMVSLCGQCIWILAQHKGHFHVYQTSLPRFNGWREVSPRQGETKNSMVLSSGSDLVVAARPAHDPEYVWLYHPKRHRGDWRWHPLAKMEEAENTVRLLHAEPKRLYMQEFNKEHAFARFSIFARDERGHFSGKHVCSVTIPEHFYPIIMNIECGRLVMQGWGRVSGGAAGWMILSARFMDWLKRSSTQAA